MSTRSTVRRYSITFAIVCLAAGLFPLGAVGAGGTGIGDETKAERDARMGWWREAKFGMFIHWGLYAIPAGTWNDEKVPGIGEWIMFRGQVPVSEYEPLKDRFNPVKYDPEEWVRIAKDAGMKYIVITSKHHDGFGLFDSALTDYDIMSTPYGRDLLKPLAEACRREGIKLCWYHSIMDWHHPDYLPRGKEDVRPWDTRPTEGASYDRYIDYMKGQLEELLTHYGEIGILWFDGGWEHSPEEHRSAEVVEFVRGLQPNIIINNRIMIPQDYDTPEQFIPPTGIPDRDWETCMTMNDTWGFKSYDDRWKSSESLIRRLVDIVSKGGNFLLNVGPTAEGLIPQPSVERLADMGRWMKVNGDSVYGTTANVFRRLEWGRCTVKPGKLYLHVFDWPASGRLEVGGLLSEVKKGYYLADRERTPLPIVREDETVVVSVAGDPLDPVDTVIVLEIDGPPKVIDMPIPQSANGEVVLDAADATIHGTTLRQQIQGQRVLLTHWVNPEDWVSWDFELAEPGTFDVRISYACGQGEGGTEYAVTVGKKALAGQVNETGSWTRFKTADVGKLKLRKRGRYTISVNPSTVAKGTVMVLRSITLKPKQ